MKFVRLRTVVKNFKCHAKITTIVVTWLECIISKITILYIDTANIHVYMTIFSLYEIEAM